MLATHEGSTESEKNTEVKNAELIKEKKEVAENKTLGFALQNLNKEHSYLEERGIEKATVDIFEIGYCSKGMMKGRIAIPIHNEKGELIAYVGRWIGDPPDNKTPKYKLPVGFHKSLEVFNLHRAKDEVGDSGLILVDGVFDCMKVWQAGYKNVVALFGSSLSERQEELIIKYVGLQGKLFLMFDNDNAVRGCCEDVLKRLGKRMFVKVVELGQEGMQPDKLNTEEIKKLLG